MSRRATSGATATPGGLVGVGGKGFNVRTGLLPAFAVFDAKGKEGETDLGVHFGFAPQIQCGGQAHDCFGAQIDMRQVFLTVGGTWGQILAGREIGLFNRQNILTDQTLFGIGATGGINGGGTTLGRIGFGYIYPNFVAQMTYSTPAGRPTQLSIGLFQPSSLAGSRRRRLRRRRGVRPDPGPAGRGRARVQQRQRQGLGQRHRAERQEHRQRRVQDRRRASAAASGSATPCSPLTGSGYWGKGIGTTLQFNGVNSGGGSAVDGLGVGDDGELRTSYGFIGQITVTPANSKVTLAGSFGSSYLKATDGETAFKTENSLISGGIYYQATKSLKVVGEGNYAWTKNKESAADKNKTFAPTIGLMLFF